MKFLIVGLGNIGEEYSNTRHNIGFTVLDALAKDMGVTFVSSRYASIAEAKIKGRHLIMIKPSTYMNLSGKAFKYWLDKENIEMANALVVADDLDLDFGVLRMRTKGSGGTHNGLNHIIETMNTQDFARLRFGIGRNFAQGFQVEYVLGRWSKEEEKALIPRIDIAMEIIKSFVLQGVSRTMNQYNNK